jgi:hypothetical protein
VVGSADRDQRLFAGETAGEPETEDRDGGEAGDAPQAAGVQMVRHTHERSPSTADWYDMPNAP